jgi:PadR family transcriptional regulator PadR
MRNWSQSRSEIFKGTLHMMILRTFIGSDAHGHTIAKVIEHTPEDLLEVEQGMSEQGSAQ